MQKATVFIVEGEKEDECYHHPKGKWSRGAYFILHHWSYATLHLITTFLFMLLVVPNTEAENSPIKYTVNVWFNDAILLSLETSKLFQFEILVLLFLTVHTMLRYVWYGLKDGIRNALFTQRRTALMVYTPLCNPSLRLQWWLFPYR